MITLLSRLKRDVLYLIILFGVLVLFFSRILFSGNIFLPGVYLRSDTLHQNLPFKYELYRSLKKGTFPFWTNSIYGGFPLFAEGETGVLYPYNLIPFLFFPFVVAYNLSMFLNFLTAAVGMFYLMRSFGTGRIAATITGILFPLSSFFVLHITHQNIVSAACWFPLLVLFVNIYVRRKLFRFALLSACIVSIQIFAGSFQIVFYSLLMGSILIVLLNVGTHKIGSILARISKITVLGFLLSSVQFIPTLMYYFSSARFSGMGNIALDSLPYYPRNLIAFLFPYVFGDPGAGTYPHFGGSWGMFWENTGYLGIVALCVAFWSLAIIREKKEIGRIWILVVTAVLFTLGKYGPLFWIYYFPPFNLFRVTGRFLLFVIFGLAILAGFTIDYWNSHMRKNLVRLIALSGLGTILIADLFLFGFSYNPTVRASDVLSPPDMAKFLLGIHPKGNIFSVADFLTYDLINANGWRNNLSANLFHRNSLGPDVNMLWGIRDLDGYSGLYPQSAQALRERIYRGMTVKKNKIIISDQTLKLLGQKHTQFLISGFVLQGAGLKERYEVSNGSYTYILYDNPYFQESGRSGSYNFIPFFLGLGITFSTILAIAVRKRNILVGFFDR